MFLKSGVKIGNWFACANSAVDVCSRTCRRGDSSQDREIASLP
jgi:hypothetical protein